MRSLDIGRYAVSISVAAASISGCGGSQPQLGTSGAISQLPTIAAHPLTDKSQKTFLYTGAQQTFVVPSDVTHVTITAMAASGASDGSSGDGVAKGGKGGWVRATISVGSGEKLAVYVGGNGSDGGFNGGGGGGNYYDTLYGGGASDVRQGGNSLQGYPGAPGQLGMGGHANQGVNWAPGGGGGGGYYGGGGGQGGAYCTTYCDKIIVAGGGGGGGGSSYTEKTATHVVSRRGEGRWVTAKLSSHGEQDFWDSGLKLIKEELTVAGLAVG